MDRTSESELFDTTEEVFVEIPIDRGDWDVTLIECIKKYPHLYSKRDRNFKNHKLRDESWVEISTCMNSPVEECQRRWIRLRERFSRERKNRGDESGNGSDSLSKHRFRLYENLLFLDEHVQTRRTFPSMRRDAPLNRIRLVQQPQYSLQSSSSQASPEQCSQPTPQEQASELQNSLDINSSHYLTQEETHSSNNDASHVEGEIHPERVITSSSFPSPPISTPSHFTRSSRVSKVTDVYEEERLDSALSSDSADDVPVQAKSRKIFEQPTDIRSESMQQSEIRSTMKRKRLVGDSVLDVVKFHALVSKFARRIDEIKAPAKQDEFDTFSAWLALMLRKVPKDKVTKVMAELSKTLLAEVRYTDEK